MAVLVCTFQSIIHKGSARFVRFSENMRTMQKQNQVAQRSVASGPCCVVSPIGVCHHRLEHRPARIIRRALPGFGSSLDGGSSSRDWQVPETLLPTGKPDDQVGEPADCCMHALRSGLKHVACTAANRLCCHHADEDCCVAKPLLRLPQAGTSGRSSPSSSTVYTLRLSTSWDRGSAMSEPMAGVHVCLIGKSGSAVLHRIPPVNDPMDRVNMMRDICSSVSLTSLTMTLQGSLPPHIPLGSDLCAVSKL
jgi:hypothetical protein